MNVGQRIKAARKAMGLSQSDLADMTDVSQPTVANWEKGSHAPRHSALAKIANALKSTPASLLDVQPQPADTILSQHHVPIIKPPLSETDIDLSAVAGYITVSCDAARPFAFKADRDFPDQNISAGDTMIFDRAPVSFTQDAVLLSFGANGISLDRVQTAETTKGAASKPRLIMSVSRF